jgi:hypothetical protein
MRICDLQCSIYPESKYKPKSYEEGICENCSQFLDRGLQWNKYMGLLKYTYLEKVNKYYLRNINK